ncbi:ATP-binding protein [Streptomyces niveus]|uniref:ATP-binding protein n=1 Tax=Streptomyces niveus TaxID=193462 RepID=UPI0035E279EF
MSTVRVADGPPNVMFDPSPWEVVRISDAIGGDVLVRLLERGTPLGPVWQTRSRGVIEVVVPQGTAATWPLAHLSPWVVCARPSWVNCPPSRRLHRRWITRPDDIRRRPATDPVALCEAITAAIVRARLVTSSRASAVSRQFSRPGSARLPGTEMQQYSPLDLPRRLEVLHEARVHVRQTLARWYVPADVADSARQVAHELLANAVEHGVGPWVSLSLLLGPRTLTVIAANDAHRPVLTPRQVDTEAEHGRGLRIVAEYADDWAPHTTDTRVVVWADFNLNPRKEMR